MMYHKTMHADEILITPQLIQQLLDTQFPQWKNLPIKPVQSSGTDNAIYRLGNDMCIRLPRIASAAQYITKEQTLLTQLASTLPLAIPIPIAQGNHDKNYPFCWSIFKWLTGKDAFIDHSLDLHQAAIDLAHFLRALQKADATGGPVSRRGVPLTTQDKEVRDAITALHNDINSKTTIALWKQCCQEPAWDKQAVWTHGDLLPTNLLVHNHKLNAVIDFDMLGIGDPACDLLPAWSLFDAETREVFRTRLAVDDATWMRGKGWALSIAVTIIPYYKNTNPTLVAIAQRMIHELTADFNTY